MVKFDVEGIQNAEVSPKLPPEKLPPEQLALMERYTETHWRYAGKDKALRELECLKILYPALLRQIEDGDLFAGRLDFLPVGFGCVTSLGGVGHYCVFAKLRALQKELPADCAPRVDALYDYWLAHDVKTLYCREVLTETTIGRFIDCDYPMIATARLSGMMLDYRKLMALGIEGLRAEISAHLKTDVENEFLRCSFGCLDLFAACADFYASMAETQMQSASGKRKAELVQMRGALLHIREQKPETFLQALQLFWLYALLSGVINYGRMDDVLGEFLAADLDAGRLTEEQAYAYIKSLWTMIENRRTTVNGRVIVGGRGRRNPAAANHFLRIAMRVCKDCRYVEPQFTLRFDRDTPQDIWDAAMDALGAGATYPTLYNDDVNIPAVRHGMRISEEAAEQYVPFGCTEFVIQGQSTGTPNVCLNLLKLLTICLNEGIDPTDGKHKSGPVNIPPVEQFENFEDFYAKYQELLDYYMDLSITAQMQSFKIMNEQVSFLFSSILMDDCVARGCAILDGGVRYLGGTNETYGNINASDSLWAIRHLAFDTRRYTLAQIRDAALADFQENPSLQKACLRADKYGNDLDTADGMAVDLYEYVAKGVRHRGIAAGMQYFLIVISNNQMNTEWGRTTAASPDGRRAGMYMNPANNPQSGADRCGPTAMLNSLVKFDPRFHAGSVQSLKLTPRMFAQQRELLNALLRGYFRQGGCHLMITAIDRGMLEDAIKHPQNYPNLLVRVSGFSAVFVDLAPDIQQEIINRMLYDG